VKFLSEEKVAGAQGISISFIGEFSEKTNIKSNGQFIEVTNHEANS
jgi:hypothetical protein